MDEAMFSLFKRVFHVVVLGTLASGIVLGASVREVVAQEVEDFGLIEEKAGNGWLGIDIEDVTPAAAGKVGLDRTIGALVIGIHKDSAAGKAGIRVGDIITAVDGKTISRMPQLRPLITTYKPGQQITLSVYTTRGKKMLKVILGKMPVGE